MSAASRRGTPAFALLMAACSWSSLDYSGKRCPNGACPAGYQCVEGFCRVDGEAAGGGGGSAGGGSAGGGSAGGGSAGGGANTGTVRTLSVDVSLDSDDAMWTGFPTPNLERLSDPDGGHTVNVGDGDSAGFRFILPLRTNAVLLDVRLVLKRRAGTLAEDAPLRVRLWSSTSVSFFDEAHLHLANRHDVGGFVPASGTLLPRYAPAASSSDLSSLLQPLVDTPGFSTTGVVGVVVEGFDAGPGWVGFEDFSASAGSPARLVVEYLE